MPKEIKISVPDDWLRDILAWSVLIASIGYSLTLMFTYFRQLGETKVALAKAERRAEYAENELAKRDKQMVAEALRSETLQMCLNPTLLTPSAHR